MYLKVLDTFGNNLSPTSIIGVSQHNMHNIKQSVKFELNWSSTLQDCKTTSSSFSQLIIMGFQIHTNASGPEYFNIIIYF